MIIVMIVLLNVQIVHYDTIQVQIVDTKPNLVLLGDSITAITGNNRSYSDILKTLWNDTVDVINEGIGGSCMKTVDVYNRITIHHPKYLIVEYGGNDIARITKDADYFYDYYNEKLNEIIKQNSNVTIFIVNIKWINESRFTCYNGYPEASQIEFNSKIKQIATERGLLLVDLWSLFYHNDSLTYDGAHQNEQGAIVIAKTMNETVGCLLNGSPFSYIEDVEIQKKYNIKTTLTLILNLQENKPNNNDYTISILILFLFSFVFAVSVVLFEERKKIIEVVI